MTAAIKYNINNSKSPRHRKRGTERKKERAVKVGEAQHPNSDMDFLPFLFF